MELLVGQMHEFLGDLLFEIELRIELLQRRRPFLESLQSSSHRRSAELFRI